MISFSGLPGEFPGASPFNLPKAPSRGGCRVQVKARPPGPIHESIQSRARQIFQENNSRCCSPRTDRGVLAAPERGRGGRMGRTGRSSGSPAPLDTDPTDPSTGTPAQGREHARGGGLREETAFPWESASQKELLSIAAEKRKNAIRNFPTVTRTVSKPTAKAGEKHRALMGRVLQVPSRFQVPNLRLSGWEFQRSRGTQRHNSCLIAKVSRSSVSAD